MVGFQAGTQGTLLTGSEVRKALLVDMEAGLLDSTHWEVLALREATASCVPKGSSSHTVRGLEVLPPSDLGTPPLGTHRLRFLSPLQTLDVPSNFGLT